MTARWEKQGLLYVPPHTGRHEKLLTHAANPLPIHLAGDVYRIFYSGRDAQNRSSVGAVDVDIVSRSIVTDHHTPFFTHGPEGSFYADGVSIGNCYTVGEERYILFMGWQAPADGHWRGDVGQLRVDAGLCLTLAQEAPFLSTSEVDPISLSYPWVMRDANDTYRMWYGSTHAWKTANGEMLHVIHGATSTDGQRWNLTGTAVPYTLGTAQAFSRPTVRYNPARGYEMWFSYRSGDGTPYRIGYATSVDGDHWQLALAATGIDVSPSGWDSTMLCYPYVFLHGADEYMLYNGDGFGKTGFGLAIRRPAKG